MSGDIEKKKDLLVNWIKERVHEAGCDGTVVGLSGGIDSAVCAALSQLALPGKVLGLILPCHSLPRDGEDAILCAEKLGVDYQIVDLSSTYDTLLSSLPGSDKKDDLALANMKPRLRMTVLYYYANRMNYLVVGTDNRSELYLGYFTKYGDGGVDITPIGTLVKGEVRELAYELGIPERIITKPPSAGLWEGQEDEEELGLSYEEVDTYILTGQAKREVKEKIEELRKKNSHKRSLPAIPDF